jgi:lysophospholipase L1-like esterase
MNKKLILFSSLAVNLIFIASAIILLQTHPRTEQTEEPKKPEIQEEVKTNIVMLGNSITYQGNWQEVLNRDDVFNGGKPCWTTQQLSWVIKNFIIPKNPVVCFFTGGINDYTLGIPTERIYQNCVMVMDSIKDCGTNPVWQTTLYQRGNISTNTEIDKLNNKMKAFCEKQNYDFVDLRPFLCKDGDIMDEYVKEDNTHLKPAAYPQWAKALQPFIKKYEL